MATVECSCCSEDRDEWDVRPLSCHPEVQVCRWCVEGLRFQFAVPNSTPILPVRDLDEAVAFYESCGFEVRVYEGGGFGFVSLDDESVFDLDEGEHVGPSAAGCFLIVHNVDVWHADLTEKGLPVSSLEDQPWGMKEFRLTDPSGNYVRIGRQSDR